MTGKRLRAGFFCLLVPTLLVNPLWAVDLGTAPRERRDDPVPSDRSEMDLVPAVERGDPREDGLLYLPLPTIKDGSLVPMEKAEQLSSALQIVVILTILTLSPGILIMMTSFLRITVVMGFVRRAIGTNSLPPDQVMVGLSLFLTFFIMWPTWKSAWNDASPPISTGNTSKFPPGKCGGSGRPRRWKEAWPPSAVSCSNASPPTMAGRNSTFSWARPGKRIW